MLERIRGWFGLVASKAAERLVRFSSANASLTAAFNAATFPNAVRYGYRGNAAVYACTRVWASTFPEPPMRVRRETDGGKVWEREHPASKLMMRPNEWMGEDVFWSFVITYMAIGGNCYVWKERSTSGAVIGLWPFHDGVIAPVPDPEGWLSHYRYDLGDGSTAVIIPPSEIVQLIWAPDPSNPVRGMGAIVAIAQAVDMATEALRYVYAYLKNDASPRTILSLKEPVGEKLKDIQKRFIDQHGGANRGGVMVIDEAEATISRIGANLAELNVESLWNTPEAWISAAFEVPAIKAGLSVGLQRGYSGANADALNQDFAATRLAPRWRSVQSQFTRCLLVDMDPDPALSLEFDTSTVQALREDENELRGSLNASVTAGWMTVNEARVRASLDKDPAGDVYLRSMGALDQPFGAPALPPPADTPAAVKADRATRKDYLAAKKLADEAEEAKRALADEYEAEILAELERIGAMIAERVA